jgi:two-component system, NtrC family, sensor kinase
VSLDLRHFGLREMLKASLEVRQTGRNEPNMEAAFRRICRYFYDELLDGDARACALVRAYKTHAYGKLPADLQRFARRALHDASIESGSASAPSPGEAMRCLTLIATIGDQSAWNDRRNSKGHQAIPLASPRIVERAPMIAQLIKGFGLDLSDIVHTTTGVVRGGAGKTYGVFHVEEALGSPYIPAQSEFVEPYRIKSVLGFGGSLEGGDLFAIILFSRSPVSADTADRFRTIALDVKSVVLPFGDAETFED